VQTDNTVLTNKDEFGPTIFKSGSVVKDPSNFDSRVPSAKYSQVGISKTADGPQISTATGSTRITGLGPNGGDNSITRQQNVQVGLTPDGPAIQKTVFTREEIDDQITSASFGGMIISPTANGGPDITRLGRKILQRGVAV
jgi:hypothetical protein